MSRPELGEPEQFAVLRNFLVQCGFTEAAVRARLDLRPRETLDFDAMIGRPAPERAPADRLDAVIFLFIFGEFLPTDAAVKLFPSAVWDGLQRLKLVSLDTADGQRCSATVALYPVRELFVASDRWNNPDHSPLQSALDAVYPAFARSTQELLTFLPFDTCENFLEICAGTGAAALLAARNARHVWATDIAERSIHFARFNAALNGIQNASFEQGDLFEAVKGVTFDCICAHPPYMPVLGPSEIYYGGGEDGEEISRRLIQNLPEYLRPSGRLYCRMLGTDRPGKPFEERVREWLGEKQGEFDIAVIAFRTMEPREFAVEETVRKGGGTSMSVRWRQLFAKNEITNLVIGMLIIQRAAGDRPAFTIRRAAPKGSSFAPVDWAMHWQTAVMEGVVLERMFQERLLLSPALQLTVHHRVHDGELSPEEFTLSTEYPFAMDCRVAPWTVSILSRCDGKISVGELFELSKQNGWILPDTPAIEFSRLLAVMIGGGFLHLESFKLPAAAE